MIMTSVSGAWSRRPWPHHQRNSPFSFTSPIADRSRQVLLLLLACLNLPVSASAEDWEYTVQPGDNLWHLSERYLVSMYYWRHLQQLNGISDPQHMEPGSILKIPLSWLKVSLASAVVTQIQGQVVITDDSQQRRTARQGMVVRAGDDIHTAANAHLTLTFEDGSRLRLKSNSHLKLERLNHYGHKGLSDTQLYLNNGDTEVSVNPKRQPASSFRLLTPSATAAVRGTEYRLSASAEESRTEVLEGGVAFQAGGKTALIPKGFGTVAKKGLPPLPPITLLPAPALDTLPGVLEQLPARFQLAALDGASAYRVSISTADKPTNPVFEDEFTSTQIHLPDTLADNHYIAWIRGVDAYYSLGGHNAEYRFTLNARPVTPYITGPQPEAITTEARPEFSWSRPDGAYAYHFQMATNPGFEPILMDRYGHAETVLRPDQILDPGLYYWRIAALDEQNQPGPYSGVRTLRRVLPAPDLEDTAIDDQHMTLSWRRGNEGQRYHLQLSRDEAFTDLLIDETLPESHYTMDRPDTGLYYIRVSTLDSGGVEGPFGQAQQIEVKKSPNYWSTVILLLPLLLLVL